MSKEYDKYIKELLDNKIKEVQNWFYNESGNADGVILGISGGKDSTCVAALLVKALGKDKVLGVLMPNGEQKDISDSYSVCEELDIPYKVVNIEKMYKAQVEILNEEMSSQALINIAPRVRMQTLYTMSANRNYRVIGTGNASEVYTGYFTKYGDGACDYNPIRNILCDDVIVLGLKLGVSEYLMVKPPSDGLTGKTDEDNFGFTYIQLNDYIRKGTSGDNVVDEKIKWKHSVNTHKLTEEEKTDNYWKNLKNIYEWKE